jgi:cystathionine beta-lyase family protein involved in aluminum resistance
VKGSHLIAAVMAAEGFDTAPAAGASRHDVITSVVLRSPARQARARMRLHMRNHAPGA